MPDYLCELPIWGATWWDLPLEPETLDDLADWQDTFDAEFEPTSGRRNASVAAAWQQKAEELIAALREELARRFQLEVDLWPLEGAS